MLNFYKQRLHKGTLNFISEMEDRISSWNALFIFIQDLLLVTAFVLILMWENLVLLDQQKLASQLWKGN